MELHSKRAEQGVLGALLSCGDKLEEVGAILSAGSFFFEDHGSIFKHMQAVQNESGAADVISVCDSLARAGLEARVGGLQYLGGLVSECACSSGSILANAKIIASYAKSRGIVDAARELVEDVTSGEKPETALNKCMEQFEKAQQSGESSYLDFGQLMAKGVDAMEKAVELARGGKMAGIPYGLPAVDSATGGMRGGQLVVVAAKTSKGKTILANQIALNNAKEGNSVGVCSIEMSDEQLAIRSMAHLYQLNNTALFQGKDNEFMKVVPAMHANPCGELPLYVNTNDNDFNKIVSQIIQWKHKHDIKLAIVDHIGIIESSGFNNNNDRIGHITRTLKKLSKSLDIPIIMVCQFSRGVDKESRRPKLSDLRDSGNIEQDVDVALFIHHEEGQEDSGYPVVYLGLLKNRDGYSGWLDQPFIFNGATMTIRQKPEYCQEYMG